MSSQLDASADWPQSRSGRTKGALKAHTRSNKFVQQCVVQQETASINDTISLRKLQSLGKCHNEKMSRAACLAVILAYATEKEAVYRKRKRSIWTKDLLKRRSVFWHGNIIKELELSSPLDYKNYLRMCPSTFRELLELFTPLVQREDTSMRDAISPNQVMWYNRSQTCPYALQIVAQTDCCATKFKPVCKSSNCCTNSQTTPHTIKQFAQLRVLRRLFDVYGALHIVAGGNRSTIFRPARIVIPVLTELKGRLRQTIPRDCSN